MDKMSKNQVMVRDAIIFADGYVKREYKGGVRRFSGLSAKKLQELIDLHLADPGEAQNNSPSIAEFLNFMDSHDGYTAHGYTVDYTRDDCRVSIEGIESPGYCEAQELEDFVAAFRDADDFEASTKRMYCWYD